MNEIKDGGPAFPCHTNPRPGTLNDAPQGMTLRDYFASHAPDVPDDFDWASGETDSWQRRARWSFHYADAMLRARGAA